MSAHAPTILVAVFALLATLSPDGLLAGVGEWTSSGPDGAVVETLAAHPSNPSTVYAATVRRLYKSMDAGASWAPTGLPGGPNLVLPTSDPSVVYATATWSSDIPIHRSSDGGETWVDRAGPLGRISSLTEDGNDPLALYAATSSGLFRTTNGGDTWDRLPSPVPGPVAVAGIALDPADSRVIYAALDIGDVSGVYRSSDRGATWTRTSLRDPVRALVFVPATGSPWDYDVPTPTLFALTSNGLQVTANGGESWRRLAPGRDVSHLAIDPTNSGHLYMISAGVVLHSSDGGETVTPVLDGNFGTGLRGIVASRSPVVLVGSDSGVSRSEDAGRLWGAPSDDPGDGPSHGPSCRWRGDPSGRGFRLFQSPRLHRRSELPGDLRQDGRRDCAARRLLLGVPHGADRPGVHVGGDRRRHRGGSDLFGRRDRRHASLRPGRYHGFSQLIRDVL